MNCKYSVGDRLVVIRGISHWSCELDGQVITIESIEFVKGKNRWFVTSKEAKEGIWEEELRKLTKLEQALR
jgi:hypothetical protein